MKKFNKFWVLALVGIIATSVIIYKNLWTTVKPPLPEPVWVQTDKVKQMTLPLEIRTIATIEAASVEVSPEIAGHVRQILFQDGAFVKKDTPLIQLDDAVYQVKLASVKAKYKYSKNQYERMLLLSKKGIISQQSIEQTEAELKEKKADLDEQEVILKKMRLIAPFDGVVGRSKVNLGDYVTVGQSTINITDITHMRVAFHLPAKYLPLIKLGQTIKVYTTTQNTHFLEAKISYIAPTVNPESRSIQIYADLSTGIEEGSIKPGMLVNIIHVLKNNNQALMIPARSLIPILDGMQVYKIKKDQAVAVKVNIGERLDNLIQITNGLKVGDVVITDGQQKLKNNMPVHIKK